MALPSGLLRPSSAATAVLLAASMLWSCAPKGARVASAPAGTVEVHVLAFNDFHGNLEPLAGGARAGRPAVGGVANLAAHLAQREAAHPRSVIVSAGDNIGASPLVSALFHDEPTIEALNALGLDFSAVGNHELDEGWGELVRMQQGGCHPRDGCQDGTPFSGAGFQFLTANVMVDPAQVDKGVLASSGWKGRGVAPLFPASAVRVVDGVRVGFIGVTLETAPTLVNATAVRGVTFTPEAEAANAAVDALVRQGVRAIVVLIHEGGDVTPRPGEPCHDFRGRIVDIVAALSPEVDVVVSGHTHNEYVCPVSARGSQASLLVTSAGAFGRTFTDITLSIDRRSGQVTAMSAENVAVTPDVSPEATTAGLVARYATLAEKDAQRPVGSIAGTIGRAADEAGESPLGRLVADAALAAGRAPEAGGAQVAFFNPGGIRTDLVRGAGGAGAITYGEVFPVLPYGNQLLVKTLRGEAILRMLEEQFDNPEPGRRTVLHVSSGFKYAYDASKPNGQRIARPSVTIDGQPLDLQRGYRVIMSDFLWNGGDRFKVPAEGTDPTAVVIDLDAFLAYLAAHPSVEAPTDARVTRLPSR